MSLCNFLSKVSQANIKGRKLIWEVHSVQKPLQAFFFLTFYTHVYVCFVFPKETLPFWRISSGPNKYRLRWHIFQRKSLLWVLSCFCPSNTLAAEFDPKICSRNMTFPNYMESPPQVCTSIWVENISPFHKFLPKMVHIPTVIHAFTVKAKQKYAFLGMQLWHHLVCVTHHLKTK